MDESPHPLLHHRRRFRDRARHDRLGDLFVRGEMMARHFSEYIIELAIHAVSLYAIGLALVAWVTQ